MSPRVFLRGRRDGHVLSCKPRRRNGTGCLLGTLLLLAYLIARWVLSPMPLQDFPTHLARAVVMDDLIFHGGTRFGDPPVSG
jgi:hypothetical protein